MLGRYDPPRRVYLPEKADKEEDQAQDCPGERETSDDGEKVAIRADCGLVVDCAADFHNEVPVCPTRAKLLRLPVQLFHPGVRGTSRMTAYEEGERERKAVHHVPENVVDVVVGSIPECAAHPG